MSDPMSAPVRATLRASTSAPLPIDETRYLGIAWAMWRDGQWPALDERPAEPFDSPFRDVFAYRDRYRRLVPAARYADDSLFVELPAPLSASQDHDS